MSYGIVCMSAQRARKLQILKLMWYRASISKQKTIK